MFGTKTMAVAAYAAAKRKQGMGKTNLKVKKTVDKRKDSCSTVGVSRHRGKFQAYAWKGGKNHYLGLFPSERHATQAVRLFKLDV